MFVICSSWRKETSEDMFLGSRCDKVVAVAVAVAVSVDVSASVDVAIMVRGIAFGTTHQPRCTTCIIAPATPATLTCVM